MATDRFDGREGTIAADINALIKEGKRFTEDSIGEALPHIKMSRIRPHIYSLYTFKKVIGRHADGSYFLRKDWKRALEAWKSLAPGDRWRKLD